MKPFHSSARARTRGFTLIEIAVVLVIVAIMIAMAAFLTRGITSAQKRSTTTSRIATVDTALVQYAMVNKRLPCPANGTVASGVAGAGTELRAGGVCTGSQQNGVVPWTTLGLSETDASDGWDRRLTYRVAPPLAVDAGLDMSFCDPAGGGALGATTPCNPACTSAALGSCTPPIAFLSGKGLAVRNIGGTALMDPSVTPSTGAAYVIVSHGESGGGGYLNSGVLFASTVGDGTEEMKNYASLAHVAGVTYYVDDTTVEIAGAGHYDDVLSRPSIMSVASKAGLGPRSH
jgi:prepilin-type N-terminal cleavage/methylation domain-containing protein